ncbi:MAG TPA: cupin domain-containing protein [Gemmataceae bacterium]|nr:cupin domain-containing protein [Gemmataceae bacterium]
MRPRHILSGSIVAALAIAWAGSTSGQHKPDAMEAAIHRPDVVKWCDGPPSLPPGAKIAVLEGDPTKSGPFVMRVKVPDGYKIPPHTHPKPERLTVISGTFHLGMGDVFDLKKGEEMPAGAYGTWPAGMKHFAWVTGETVVQLHGDGPWAIHYLNPTDDPRNVKK